MSHPIFLNLLPPAHKESFSVLKLTKRTFRAFFAMLFLLVVFDVLLANTFLFLKVYNKDSAEVLEGIEAQSKLGQIEEIQKRFDRAKADFFAIQPLVQEPPRLEDIEYIARLMPDEIEVLTLSVNRTTKSVSIQCFARTRQDVLRLEEILKNADRVTNLDFPHTNFIPAKDINVFFSFELKAVTQ